MKTFTLFLIVLSIFAIPSRAETVSQADHAKRDYYLDGTLKEEWNYNSEKKDEALVKKYYPSGKLMKEFNLKKGKGEGLAKAYYENGALEAEVHYKNGKWNGPSKMYYETGELLAEGNFVDGDGLEKQYYPSGKSKAEAYYQNQKPEGIRKEYYESGAVRYEDAFEHGRRIQRKKYAEDGRLEFDQKYGGNRLDNTLNYLWNNFNQDMDPQMGKEYYESGALKKEGMYIIGDPQGIERTYYEDGILKYEDTYRKGQLVRRKKYSPEGRLEFDDDQRGGFFRRMFSGIQEKKIFKTQTGAGGPQEKTFGFSKSSS